MSATSTSYQALQPGPRAADSAVDVLGLACRFPESAGAAAFWRNLSGGVDMLTSDARRWPPGALGTPTRFGKVPDAAHFDASFFSVHGKQAQARTCLCLDNVNGLARLPLVGMGSRKRLAALY